MIHLEAYSSSIASGTTPLLQLTAVPSQIYPPAANGLLVQQLNKVLLAAMLGPAAIRAQLQSPTLRKNPFIDIVPPNRGTLFGSPVRIADFSATPLVLSPNEELDVFATQNNGAPAIETVGIWFSDGPRSPRQGGAILTVHATASATLTAAGWTTVTFALDTQLDPGTYAIVGMRGFSATGELIRVIPNSAGQVYRPGVTMVQAYDGLDMKYARNGELGTFCTFATTNLPKFELFASAADVAEELWLDLVQVGTQLNG